MQTSNGKMNFSATISNKQLRQDAEESRRLLKGIGSTATQEGERIDNAMANIGKSMAGIFAVSKLKDFAVQVAKVRGEFQQLEVAFQTMLGSKAQADALMSQLIRTAATTPFGMTDIANSAKQLLAYGVAADEVNETLIRLGDIAAGLSIPINDLAYLYGTTMVQGRLYTQDLNQFLGRGIPLMKELADQFGVAESKVKDLVQEGKVGFQEVQKAIISLTSEGSQFGGLMEAQSKTITGQISNIEDAIEQMFNELGKQQEGVISGTLSAVSWMVDHWQEIGKAIMVVITAYGTYKAAVLAVAAAHKIANIAGSVQAFLSLTKSVHSAKDAMLLFNMACSANPLGLVIGVVAAAAVSFGLFSSSTSKAQVMTEKYGETAATAINRVDTLTKSMNGLTAGSSSHKKVLSELNGILEEYGLSALEEGASIDEVNAKREQAIELIKQEAIERQRLNALDAGAEEYKKALEDAFKGMYEGLSEAQTGVMGTPYVDFFTDNDELQGNAAAISTIIRDIVQNNISKIADKTGDEYEKGLNEMYALIQDRMRAIGISEETIASAWMDDGFFYHSNIIADYIGAVQGAQEANTRYNQSVEANAAAERAAAGETMSFSDKMNATRQSLSKAADDTHALYKRIKTLMSQYSDNNIGFHISFDGEVPEWMTKMEIPELNRLAAHFSALGQTLGEGQSASVNGVTYTKQQALQRGALYAQAAEQKQTAADKAQKEADATEKERKRKAEAAAKAAERERKQIADQTADRNKQLDEYDKQLAVQTEQNALDLRQQKLDLEQDGFDKEMALLTLNYDKLIAENDKREREMLSALANKQLLEWMNENPKATKEQQVDFLKGKLNIESPTAPSRKDLAPEQQAQLEAYETIANQIKLKGQEELYKRLLSEFQDYETRRTAINKEYDDKRKALEEMPPETAGREAAIAELERQRIESLKRVNNEEVEALQKSSALMIDLFSDATDKSDKQMRKLIDDANQLLNYLKNTDSADITPQFGFTAEQLRALQASPDQIKAITDKVKELQESVNKSNPFKSLSKAIQDIFNPKDEKTKNKSIESKLKTLGASASECADMVGGVASKLSEMFEASGNQGAADAMDAVSDAMTSVSNIGKGFAEGGLIGGIAAAAGEAIGYVTKAFQANARHKAALKEILKEVTAQQRAYNLALMEESLAYEKADTVFGTLDYLKAANAVTVMKDAWAALNEEIRGTTEQQKKFQSRYSLFNGLFMSSHSKLKQAYAGLADIEIKTGHKKTGLFGWGKGKDLYSSILSVYPELIDKQGKFNVELAKSIIDTRTFNGEGKEALQYIIDLYEEAEKAYEQVKDYLSGIFGELGNTMSDALVDAFRNGTDAAEAFADSVTKMLENIGQQMIFSALFSGIIQQANDQMLEVMTNQSLSEEQKFNQYISILDAMTTGILGQQDNYNDLMERYKKLAEGKGIDLWDADSESGRTASSKGIASASQDSVDELNGRATAIQGHTFSIAENTQLLLATTQNILKSVMHIESETDGMGERLGRMEERLKNVDNTLDDISTKGIRLKS